MNNYNAMFSFRSELMKERILELNASDERGIEVCSIKGVDRVHCVYHPIPSFMIDHTSFYPQ